MTRLKDRIIAFMRENPGKNYSSHEIATHLFSRHSEEYKNKEQGQLANEVAGRFHDMEESGEAPQIKLVEGVKPKRRYWDENVTAPTDKVTSKQGRIRQPSKPRKTKEHDLYPHVINYLYDELGVRAFRIGEGKSSNKSGRGANWQRHPDIVGVEGMIGNKGWNSHVRQLASELSYVDNAKIWSMEVKSKINNVGELRRYYNQALSNSSWANLGYLVVGEIVSNKRIEEEIKLLTGGQPIGIIVIDKKRPENSIHIEAEEREMIDLDFCNVLANENTDFAEFIDYATNIFKTGKVY